MVKPGWVLVIGIALGVVLTVGLIRLGPVFGQSMPGPMGPMMAQMMGPEARAGMMVQMMRDPASMRVMGAACAQAMRDPAVRRSMQKAMADPQMRQMMQEMLEIMGR